MICCFWKNVLFGPSDGSRKNICVYIINLIIINKAKYHIHRWNLMGRKPCFIALNGELYFFNKNSLKLKACIDTCLL